MSDEWEYPRESVEYVFFEELLVNGLPPAGATEYAMTTGLARPLVWNAILTQDNKPAFLLNGNNLPGQWKIWVRVPDSPEASVIEAGVITIT